MCGMKMARARARGEGLAGMEKGFFLNWKIGNGVRGKDEKCEEVLGRKEKKANMGEVRKRRNRMIN